MSKTIFIIRGTPGSGKTTLARSLCPIDDICEADKFFERAGLYDFDPSKLGQAHSWCRREVESRMLAGVDRIAVSNTFTQLWEFEPYLEMAKLHGYRAVCLVVENRHGSSSVHSVPEDKVEQMRRRFEVML